MPRFLLIFIAFFIIHASVIAQPVVIKGRVTNMQTHEGIPFASVFIKGSSAKTLTDFDGYYRLPIKHASYYTIGSTCIGYNTVYKKTDKSSPIQIIDFTLAGVDSTAKQMAILKKNQGRALKLIEAAIKNKSFHSRFKINSFGCEAYTKIQLDLNEINERFRRRKLFHPFQFMFENIDSASQNKPFLPFFISETVSDYFYQKKLFAGREIIKASKISGVDDINISQFLGTTFAQSDIYDKYVVILKREFLSPLSDAGISSYNYYVEDSQVIDKFKCYRIRFEPKTPKLLRLQGEIWITDSTYAIKQVSFAVKSSSNINLVSEITLHKEYTPVRDSVWMLKKENLSINFARFGSSPEMVLRKTGVYKNFILNPGKQSIDSLFKNGRPDISVSDSAHLKSDAYWENVRKDAGTIGNEDKVYDMIDTLGRMKITRNYINLLQTVFIGFTDLGRGPISLGSVYSLVGQNEVQGWHFRLGLRTNSRMSKVVRIGAFAGYGLLDKKLRYGGDVLWVIKKYPRITAFVSYRFDLMTNPNASSFFKTPDFFTTYGARRIEGDSFLLLKLMDNRELKFRFYEEFKFGYSYQIDFKNQRLQPLGYFNFSYLTAPDNVDPNTNISTFTNTEFSITQRFAWKERFFGNNFVRYSLGSKYPIVFFQYAFGVKHVIGSQFTYQRLTGGFNDTRLLGPLGKLRINVEAGRVFGTIPYILLPAPDASETYVSWWPGFNTIPQYMFTADRYVKAMIDHHLEGLIFDRIPGFSRLKWREVWSARMWWGDLTQANQTANYANLASNPDNIGPVKVQTADKVPFLEMSAGIENILSFFRLDAVWRVTHLDPAGNRFSVKHGNFGPRLAFEAQF